MTIEMTAERRDELEEKYVDEVVEGMDMKTLYQYACDSISDCLQDCGDVEFLENVAVNHEHLLSHAELLAAGVDHVPD